MPIISEIAVKNKPRKALTGESFEIEEFVEYLNRKHKGWGEFVIANKGQERIQFIKTGGVLTSLTSNSLYIGNLITYLNSYHRGWERFAISSRVFKSINIADLKPGMLCRSSTSNTNRYIYINEVTGKDDSLNITATEECDTLEFKKKTKLTLLAEECDKPSFDSISWDLIK